MRAVFVRRSEYTLSTTGRAAKHAVLSTHPYLQEGGKYACLDPSAPGCHYQPDVDSGRQSQQERDPDAHLYLQEGAFSEYNLFQPGGSYQPGAHFSQQEEAYNDDITSQQEGA